MSIEIVPRPADQAAIDYHRRSLKHCPFCGSPAEFEYTPWDEEDQSGDDGSGKVECIKCGASISGYVDDAIEKWNSRLS